MHKLGIFELLDALSAMVDGESPEREETASAADGQSDGAPRTAQTPPRENFTGSDAPYPEAERRAESADAPESARERDDAAALEAFYRRHEEISNRAKKNQ